MSAPLVPSPVRIIGTGLIGGSLGLALTHAGVDVQVQDSSPGTEALAVEIGAGHSPGREDPAPRLVLVAAPPDVTGTLVADALARWPEAIVADVASVKTTVLESVQERATPAQLRRYVGAHPMAGREVSGIIGATGDLFAARPFLVVPHAETREDAVSLLRAVALDIGSIPLVLDAVQHDRAVAHVSHVPQVVASLLAASLLDAPEASLELAGQGLRDTSRIAASDPRLWVEILGANARAVSPVLTTMRERLDAVIHALDSLAPTPPDAEAAALPDGVVERHGTDVAQETTGGSRRPLAQLIADGNRGVRRIPGKHGGAADAFATVVVLVPDRPGELARLLTEIGEIGVNLEDVRLEHSFAQKIGLAQVSVDPAREDGLIEALRGRGWSVADA